MAKEVGSNKECHPWHGAVHWEGPYANQIVSVKKDEYRTRDQDFEEIDNTEEKSASLYLEATPRITVM
jgi:hypothetical protein